MLRRPHMWFIDGLIIILKFLIVLEQGAQYFHFGLGPTNSVAGPETHEVFRTSLAHGHCQLLSLLPFSRRKIVGKFPGLTHDSEAGVLGVKGDRGVGLVHEALISAISCQWGRVRKEAAQEIQAVSFWLILASSLDRSYIS